jgi:hypothetical protein
VRSLCVTVRLLPSPASSCPVARPTAGAKKAELDNRTLDVHRLQHLLIKGVMRFFVSFLFGLLAEFATGLVIAAGMLITHGSAMPSTPEFPSWVPIVAIVAGSLFTFLIAVWRAWRQQDRAVAHGLAVAAGAVVLHLATSLGGGQTLTALHVVADVLKLVAGAVAGAAVRRRSGLSTEVA